MAPAIAGTFLIVFAFVLYKRKKWPKLQNLAMALGAVGLLGGAISRWADSVADYLDRTLGGFLGGLAGTAAWPVAALAGFGGALWWLLEMWPKSKPGKNLFYVSAALPFLVAMIPGQVGQSAMTGLQNANAAVGAPIAGLFGDGGSAEPANPPRKAPPPRTPAPRPATPPPAG